MSNKKQTAFQWYMEQHNILVQVCDNMPFDERFIRFSSLVDKAKQMEKEQIEEAYKYARAHWSREDGNAERYYEQTYGGNK
jgi:hypothetical protein